MLDAIKITNKQLDSFILNKTRCKLTDISGDSGFVVILYRYVDHRVKHIRFRDDANNENVIPLYSVHSITGA